MEREQDHRGADAEPRCACCDRRRDDERRGQEPVMVLMVFAEEAGVEAAGFGQLGFGDHLVDAAIEMLAAWRIRDRAVEAEFHAVVPCDAAN